MKLKLYALVGIVSFTIVYLIVAVVLGEFNLKLWNPVYILFFISAGVVMSTFLGLITFLFDYVDSVVQKIKES